MITLFIFEVEEKKLGEVERLFKPTDYSIIGKTIMPNLLLVRDVSDKVIIQSSLVSLKKGWKNTLSF